MTVLFVAAVSEEAAHLPEGADLLVTGIGTLPAAITLTEELCARRANGTLPQRIINVGTCGALRDEIPNGVYEIDRVHKHDFNVEFTSDIAFDAFPRVITPATTGLFPTGQLATGDTFVEDSGTRERIAQVAGLVDMEGYALAAVAHRFDVPITLLKQISDRADEETAPEWADAVEGSAVKLADAVERLLAAL